jgi:hypothetical protein
MLHVAQNSLDACNETLEEILKMLLRHTPRRLQFFANSIKRLTWSYEKRKDSLEAVQRHVQVFQLVLTTISAQQGEHLRVGLQELWETTDKGFREAGKERDESHAIEKGAPPTVSHKLIERKEKT